MWKVFLITSAKMGNETSGFQPHAGVSKQEIERLQKTFPQQQTAHLWKAWSDILDKSSLEKIEKSLRNKSGLISFQNYQQFYGDAVKGDVDKKIKFLQMLSGSSNDSDLVNTDSLLKGLSSLAKAFVKSVKNHKKRNSHDDEDDLKFSQSLLHDLIFKDERRKNTFSKDSDNIEVSLDEVEKLILKTPLVESLISSVISRCFQMPVSNSVTIPDLPDNTVTSLSLLQTVFLNSHLPHELRTIWRPLFNTDTDGESFSKFAGAIMKQGPTLIIIWDEVGNIFGGFATDSWKLGPKFFGKPETFLFHLHPKMNIYDSTPFNTNYQYFNLKQKTMPNGLGMGGQLEYYGFWIDNEFGIVKTSPSCSTYHSPQLALTEGKIRRLEVFGVGELKDDDLEAGPSVLDMDPEAQAVLEMMGKTFHSKIVREVDEGQEKKKELEKQFS